MIDFRKARRQLEAALNKTTSGLRVTMLELLLQAYMAYEKNNGDQAKAKLKQFDEVAKTLKWQGSGTELPRPFNHKHLERLYWDLQKGVNGVMQPGRTGRRHDEFSELSYPKGMSGKPAAKPRWK